MSSTRLQDERSELKRTQASLEKALNLNAVYRQELASRCSVEQDKDETHRQVEEELAKVITSLTEEVPSLRQQLDVGNKKEDYYVSLLKRKEEEICQMESQLDQSKRLYESRLEELKTKTQNGCCCCSSTWMIRMQIYLVVLTFSRSYYQIVMLCNIFIFFLSKSHIVCLDSYGVLFIDLM